MISHNFMEEISSFERGQTYYEILQCAPSSTMEQITGEYRLKAKLFHPDKQIDNQERNTDEFQRINEAYSVLSDEKQRSDYDKWLNSGLAIPYTAWKKIGFKTSLHWCVAKNRTLKLNGKESSLGNFYSKDDDILSVKTVHKMKDFSTSNSARRKFRNYQI